MMMVVIMNSELIMNSYESEWRDAEQWTGRIHSKYNMLTQSQGISPALLHHESVCRGVFEGARHGVEEAAHC